MSHPYVQDIDACLDDRLGEHGLTGPAFRRTLEEVASGIEGLRRRHADGSLPLLHLPDARADLTPALERAAFHREAASLVVVLGTGGSSLGGQSLYALADAGFGPALGGPRIVFLDNVDPATFAELFRTADPATTHLIAISKSGSTAETLSQFTICYRWLSDTLGESVASRQVTLITEPADNVLRRLGDRFGIPMLDHDPGVGGRFSVLSLVGLLPAAIAGLDVHAVRAGAAAVLHATLDAGKPADSDPATGAAVSIGLWRERGIGTSVLMPYLDRLAWFGMWYRQLWAESLGKDGNGTLPVRAMGTVDQHSQVQLYLAGPRDKMFSVVIGETSGTGQRVDRDIASDPALDYLAGRTMGDLLGAEAHATAETLIRNGRPTRLFRIAEASEYTVGGLMMHYMLETILAAHLLAVDPFDQPAVEEGKILTRQYLADIAPAG